MDKNTSDKLCPRCKGRLTVVVSGEGTNEVATRLVCSKCGHVENTLNESLKRKLHD